MSAAPARQPVTAEQTPREDALLDRRCRRCSCGIATAHLPTACLMCRANSWEPAERRFWSELDAGWQITHV